jgi:hypothetical protein
MGQGNVDDFRLLEADKTAARVKLGADRETDLTTSAAELAGILESLLSPTDAAALKGELAEYLSYTGHEGLAPGSQARLYPEDGHLTLLENRVGEVHAWLADYL